MESIWKQSARYRVGAGLVALLCWAGASGAATMDGTILANASVNPASTPAEPGTPSRAIQWSLEASMQYQRDNTANAVINGQIYVLGGAPAGLSVLNYVERYDIPSNTWTTLAPLLHARYGLTAQAVNGYIYALGGTTAVDGSGPIAPIEVYDPQTNSWSLTVPSNPQTLAAGTAGQPLAAFPNPRWGLRSVLIDGLIYAVGGTLRVKGNNVYFASIDVYDPVHNTWSLRSPMPVAMVQKAPQNGREGAAAALVNGILYVIGGWGGWPELSLVQAYDPKADRWYSTVPPNSATRAARTVGQVLAEMPTARDDFGYGVVDGRIYAISGDRNNFNDYARTSCCTPVVESYDPVANTWRSETPTLINRDDFETSVVAGQIYNLAGSRDGSFTATPAPPTPTSPPAPPLNPAFMNANQGGYSLTTNEVGVLSSIPVPTGLTASVSGTRVTWSWAAVPGARSYRLYWSLLPGVTTHPLTSRVISGLTGTQTRQPLARLSTKAHWAYAVVTAVTARGESLPSDEVAVQW